MKIKSIPIIQRQSGQSMVEFALVAPILFLVILGTCEFGYGWMQNNTVTSAVREGARAGSVAPLADIQTVARARAQQVLDAAHVSGYSIIFPKMPTPADPSFTMTVTVPYAPIVGSYIIRGLPFNLTGTTTMHFEGSLF